jgi:CRP-like cAMP-binding protein
VIVRRVVGAFAAITVGEWVLGTSVAVHAYPVGGALLVGLIGFRCVPAAAAGLFTVRFAETRRQERVLTVTALTRATVSGLVAGSLALGLPFGVAVLLVWLDAMAGSAYRPAQASLLPRIARTPSELTAATVLTSNAKTSSQLLGALVGGVLIASLPVATVVLCATALYLVGACATAGIGGAGRRVSQSGIELRGRLRGMRDGMAALTNDREARQIVAYGCLRALIRGLWIALGVVAALQLLGLGKAGFGVLMAAAGAGALVGIPLSAWLVGRRRLAPWLAGGLLMCGVPIAAIGGAAIGAVAIGFMVVWGLGMALSDVAGQALLNRVVPAGSIARVTGLLESSKLLFEGAGSLLAPLLVTTLGIRAALIAAGAAVTVVVAASWRSFARIDARAVGRVKTVELVAAVSFFRRLRVDALEGVVAQLTEVAVPAGQVVIVEGARNETSWYLVQSGELEVLIDRFLVNELHRGDGFGELALMRDTPRAATVRARTPARLLSLERAAFLTAVAGPEAERGGDVDQSGEETEDPAELLAHAWLLRGMNRRALDKLVESALIHEVDAGTRIITAGELDDSYHVLLRGRAVVLAAGGHRRDLLPGDGFGEIAALHRIPRSATVVVAEPCRLLTISGDALRAVARERGGRLGELAAAEPTSERPSNAVSTTLSGLTGGSPSVDGSDSGATPPSQPNPP